MNAYDNLVAAARWAETHHTPPIYVSTAPELYELAALVAAGDDRFNEMPTGLGWSDVVIWLEKHLGIDVVTLARARCDLAPMEIWREGKRVK